MGGRGGVSAKGLLNEVGNEEEDVLGGKRRVHRGEFAEETGLMDDEGQEKNRSGELAAGDHEDL